MVQTLESKKPESSTSNAEQLTRYCKCSADDTMPIRCLIANTLAASAKRSAKKAWWVYYSDWLWNIREKAGVWWGGQRTDLSRYQVGNQSFRDEIVQGLNRDLKIILISDYDMDTGSWFEKARFVTLQNKRIIRSVWLQIQSGTNRIFSGKKEDSCLFQRQEHHG